MRPRILNPVVVNDQEVIVFLNKTSIFTEYIINYKSKIQQILSSGVLYNQFTELKDVSKDMTNCILKTIYFTKGMDGILK
jgi:hypothetical protein